MTERESQPRHENPTLHLLFQIASGLVGEVEVDNGGNWSAEHGAWVDHRFQEDFEALPPGERRFVETLVEAGLAMGAVFRKQLADEEERVMWPEEVFEPGGGSRVLEAFKLNPSVGDPYSVLADGLENPATPYSRHYQEELMPVRLALGFAAEADRPSALAQRDFFQSLLVAYAPDEERISQTPNS